jgi:hypothetical protein
MKPRPEDPIVRSSRREAVLTVVIWASTLAYTVGYCYTHGYSRGAGTNDRKLDASLEGMTFYFGWPDWVFWGIVVPWGVCTVVSAIFAFVFMRDAPLAAEGGDEPEDLS